MTTPNSPAVVLLSGGVDSSTLLHHVAREPKHRPVYALSFNYGQRHVDELDCASKQSQIAGVAEHRVIDMSFLGDLLKSATSLTAGGQPVPDLSELDEKQREQPSTYVPNRNMILLSLAAAHAETLGAADVFYGAQQQDEYGYWDCTEEFIDRLNATLSLNRRNPVNVSAPFIHWGKADILRLGLELDVDYSLTWSCYRGADVACGTCPTCVERLKAFEAVGVSDPIAYAG